MGELNLKIWSWINHSNAIKIIHSISTKKTNMGTEDTFADLGDTTLT